MALYIERASIKLLEIAYDSCWVQKLYSNMILVTYYLIILKVTEKHIATVVNYTET